MSKTLEELGIVVPNTIYPITVARALYETAKEELRGFQEDTKRVILKLGTETSAYSYTRENIRDLAHQLLVRADTLYRLQQAVDDTQVQLKRHQPVIEMK